MTVQNRIWVSEFRLKLHFYQFYNQSTFLLEVLSVKIYLKNPPCYLPSKATLWNDYGIFSGFVKFLKNSFYPFQWNLIRNKLYQNKNSIRNDPLVLLQFFCHCLCVYPYRLLNWALWGTPVPRCQQHTFFLLFLHLINIVFHSAYVLNSPYSIQPFLLCCQSSLFPPFSLYVALCCCKQVTWFISISAFI